MLHDTPICDFGWRAPDYAMRQIALTGKGPEHQAASIGCSIKWR
jgi:hypothetical protein